LATELHWQSLYNRLRDHGQKGLAIEALSAADDLKDIGVTLVGHRRKLLAGIVNLAARDILVMSVARRLGSEGPLLAYCAAPL
jgi:hypothetical protein